jgi:hypothetical protein
LFFPIGAGKRFNSSEILTDEHFREACRYVVLNPVRAGVCDDPAEWRWSSYRASAGYDEAPPYLALGELLGPVDPGAAIGRGEIKASRGKVSSR